MPRSVFVGSDPPADRHFDLVVEPAARVDVEGAVAVPDIRVVKELLTEAVPVIDELTADPSAALLRDEFFQLVLSVARVEAALRELDPAESHVVYGTRHLPRPSRPARIAEGLARFIGADVEWIGPYRLSRFPAEIIGSGRALRWTRADRPDRPPRLALAVGGPSERRALEPVWSRLDGATMLDYGLEPDRTLAAFGAYLSAGDAVSSVDSVEFARRSTRVWGTRDWWGARWLPWVRRSLQVMGRITLKEGVLFERAAMRALTDAEILVTAKVRYARSRAISSAARKLGVPTIAIQHGMYVDGNEWTDLQLDVFGVSGDSFADVLRRRGFDGEIVPVGAPFYTVPDHEWDCGIALQPPEGVVITSDADYERHAKAAYRAARSVFGADAVIGFRLHPREDGSMLRRMLGEDVAVSRDPHRGGTAWISIESSFIVEAILSGAPTIMMNLNDHPWEYGFADMPGISLARSQDEIERSLRNPALSEEHVDAWRQEFAVTTGTEAADAITALVADRVG